MFSLKIPNVFKQKMWAMHSELYSKPVFLNKSKVISRKSSKEVN
jgi:hypothetical protein